MECSGLEREARRFPPQEHHHCPNGVRGWSNMINSDSLAKPDISRRAAKAAKLAATTGALTGDATASSTKPIWGKASSDLTLDRLEEAAVTLAGRMIRQPVSLPTQPTRQHLKNGAVGPLHPAGKVPPPTLPLHPGHAPRLTSHLPRRSHSFPAPGGFGKSTMLNAWREESAGMPVAWAALDADDDHLLRFWSTVIMALQAVRPGLGQNLMPLPAARRPSRRPRS